MTRKDLYRRQDELYEAQELDYMLQAVFDCDFIEVDKQHVGEKKFSFYLTLAKKLSINKFVIFRISEKGFVLSNITDEALSFIDEGGFTELVKYEHSIEDIILNKF